MKQFGIVTYNLHCIFTNYGSALQQYALLRKVNELSDDIEAIAINYCPDSHLDSDPLNPMKKMWDADVESKKMCELSMPAIRKNYEKFTKFFNEHYKISHNKYTSKNLGESLEKENLSGYICGGDTIFDIKEFKGFDDGYYANFPEMRNSLTISYGASFGDAVFTEDDFSILKDRICNFKALGVRESTNIDFIKSNSKVPVQKVLDPTLLFTGEDYECITAPRIFDEPYILLYSRRYNKNMEEYADRLAQKINCKVVEISLRATNADRHTMFYEAGVEEFLSLVKHAKFCVTNSFHGAIFASLMHTDFCVFSREGCDRKIDELLETLGLEDRKMVTGKETLPDVIDFDAMENRLKTKREESESFLKYSIARLLTSFYLKSREKNNCVGCEACVQVCSKNAITLVTDEEGFRYPKINDEKCVNCGMCEKVCPNVNLVEKHQNIMTYGGYIKDEFVKSESTSGGFFTAIANAFCDDNYAIFGAESDGLRVFHSFVTDKNEISKYRQSKYSQSEIGNCYKQAKEFLKNGKKVLFSGTPCQIAGLLSFLNDTDRKNLLTVEVICEGVPSPLYIQKYADYLEKKHSSKLKSLDYRYKKFGSLENPISKKWDFEAMQASLQNQHKVLKDRWFNPFWSVWLQHLMSRPSCYKCQFTTSDRVADISLGDLWGVHLYCPELYGKNGGCSLALINTEKGKSFFKKAIPQIYGHELDFETAKKYQSPLRKTISENPKRKEFMADLQNPEIGYKEINKKYAVKPSLKLLWQKYVWGNQQKVFVWNLIHRNNLKENDVDLNITTQMTGGGHKSVNVISPLHCCERRVA